MPILPSVSLRVYPDDCDAYGHVNQAAFLRIFERARWEVLAGGPGLDVFSRAGAWPAIRRAAVEYHAPAFPGDRLEFDLALVHLGRSSMSLYQRARREGDGALVATGQFVVVCIDGSGSAVPVPAGVREFFGVRPSVPPPALREVTVDGSIVAYETGGDGRAVLFLHGFPLDRTMWRHQVTALHGYWRLAPDLPGFGLSPGGPVSIAGYADSMIRFLDELRIDAAVVCALSMGGYIAFEMLRRHPDRISGLVLANTRAEADSPDGRTQREAMIEGVARDGNRILVDSMLPRLLSPSAERVVRHQVQSMIEGVPPATAVASVAAMRDRADSTGMLADVAVPVTVVGGEDDAIIPSRAQQQLAGKIPGARLELIPRAGHMAPLEQPDVFTGILRSFLKRLE